ncbi:MAG: glutathione S-transferase N-terminal domain-containing protein, partial [Polyangiales bacterium]
MTSALARRVDLEAAWSETGHSEFCCLIYATQNGWKLPILFEEMGVPYDWALVDFAKNEQRSEEFLAINPNGRIPALIDRTRGVSVAESGAILEYVATRLDSPLLPSPKADLQLHLQVK